MGRGHQSFETPCIITFQKLLTFLSSIPWTIILAIPVPRYFNICCFSSNAVKEILRTSIEDLTVADRRTYCDELDELLLPEGIRITIRSYSFSGTLAARNQNILIRKNQFIIYNNFKLVWLRSLKSEHIVISDMKII